MLYCFSLKFHVIHFLELVVMCSLLSERVKSEGSRCLGTGPQPDVEAGDSAAGELAVHQQAGEATHATDERNQQTP